MAAARVQLCSSRRPAPSAVPCGSRGLSFPRGPCASFSAATSHPCVCSWPLVHRRAGVLVSFYRVGLQCFCSSFLRVHFISFPGVSLWISTAWTVEAGHRAACDLDPRCPQDERDLLSENVLPGHVCARVCVPIRACHVPVHPCVPACVRMPVRAHVYAPCVCPCGARTRVRCP